MNQRFRNHAPITLEEKKEKLWERLSGGQQYTPIETTKPGISGMPGLLIDGAQ
ncbi:MAG: hypothetical protein WCD86_16140 [Ktedonobacteraceae bacterium]